MGLFGKKKKADELEEEIIENETAEVEEEETSEADSEIEAEAEAENESEAQEASDEAVSEGELTPEELFKKASTELSQRIRLMFPQQMQIGFYYAELQEDEYVDDLCCYVISGELIERDEIPTKCGMSYPDMVAREEKLEQAFFRFRKAAEAFSGKPCHGITVTMVSNGQIRLEIISNELVAGEEDARYARFREKVEKSDPRYLPPIVSKEEAAAIQQKTAPIYQELGTEFFSFLPEAEFKKAYFYVEISNGGAFMHHRMVLEDGEILDGDDMYERFGMDREVAERDRMEIVRKVIGLKNILIQEKHKPFTTVTLTITSKGEFRSFMGFGAIDPEGEQTRLADWKAHFNGNEVMDAQNQ